MLGWFGGVLMAVKVRELEERVAKLKASEIPSA